jgi:CPA1 family monovalent cation:H+ antiporter
MNNIYTIFAWLITFAVAIAYINYRFIKLQTSIALMLGSLCLSVVAILISNFGINSLHYHITIMVHHLHFHDLLINGMLSFLLFAGALNIELPTFKLHKWLIGSLATVSTIASTMIIATLTFYLFQLFHYPVPLVYCFLFGALISPTDPIAVLAMCKEIRAPKSLSSILGGESLFNDGVGIVLFLLALHVATTTQHFTSQDVLLLFVQQSVGGVVYGFALGWLGSKLMRSVPEIKLKALITIAMVTGGYGLAESLGLSAPLAMVMAGITVNNHFHDDEKSFIFLKEFWEILDEFLNALLFLIIGFEIIVINISSIYIILTMIIIVIVLLTRSLTVYIPVRLFGTRAFPQNTAKVLIWGGLRGGLAIALALSIPPSNYRDIIVTMTYGIVMFSILVQGMTIKKLLKKTASR